MGLGKKGHSLLTGGHLPGSFVANVSGDRDEALVFSCGEVPLLPLTSGTYGQTKATRPGVCQDWAV